MPLHDYKTHRTRDHAFWRFALALVVASGLLLVSTVSVNAAWDMYQTFDVAGDERVAAETELAALKVEYATMVATLGQLSTERGLEAVVRERFGVVRPGEGEIRIIRPASEVVVEKDSSKNPFSRLFNALLAW